MYRQFQVELPFFSREMALQCEWHTFYISKMCNVAVGDCAANLTWFTQMVKQMWSEV